MSFGVKMPWVSSLVLGRKRLTIRHLANLLEISESGLYKSLLHGGMKVETFQAFRELLPVTDKEKRYTRASQLTTNSSPTGNVSSRHTSPDTQETALNGRICPQILRPIGRCRPLQPRAVRNPRVRNRQESNSRKARLRSATDFKGARTKMGARGGIITTHPLNQLTIEAPDCRGHIRVKKITDFRKSDKVSGDLLRLEQTNAPKSPTPNRANAK